MAYLSSAPHVPENEVEGKANRFVDSCLECDSDLSKEHVSDHAVEDAVWVHLDRFESTQFYNALERAISR